MFSTYYSVFHSVKENIGNVEQPKWMLSEEVVRKGMGTFKEEKLFNKLRFC